nr:hypothetical protein [Tanacetum cinerariifolium]
MIVKSKILYDILRFFGVLVAEHTTSGAVNLTFKMNRDMIIENLYLEPKINAMVRDFLESPSRWKELSNGTGNKILPSGDGFDRSSWNEHPFCTNWMVSDRRGTTLFSSRSSMVFQ